MNMNRYKSRCPWCPKSYSSAGHCSNHLAKAQSEKTRKRQFSHISSENETHEMEFDMSRVIPLQCFDSADSQARSEGSDNEVCKFLDSESDGEGQEILPTNQTSTSSVTQSCAGTPIRDVVFPEWDPDFNLYALFLDCIDYTLACFFTRAKVSRAAINEFLKNGILNDLNLTHKVVTNLSCIYAFVCPVCSWPSVRPLSGRWSYDSALLYAWASDYVILDS